MAKVITLNASRSTRRLKSFSRILERLEPRVLLAGDLVAHWSAEDLQGDDGAAITAWADSVAGINGVATGTPILQKNVLNGRSVVSFDGADGADQIRIIRHDNPTAGIGDFSVAVVFSTMTTDAPSADGPWYDHVGIVDSSTGGFSTDWGISLNSQAQVSAGMGGGFGKPSSTIYSQEQGLNDGEPHIAIFTRSGSTMSLYVDGGSASTASDASADPRATSIDLVFGGIQGGIAPIPFAGAIAEVQIFNGFMNDAEAAALHSEILSAYQNSAPQAVDDEYSIGEDPLLFVVSPADGVLANDVDADGDSITATLVDSTQHGTLSLNANGSFIYTPETNFFGTDTFTYTASDFRPGNVATVSIHVEPEYDPATPIADTYKSLANRVLDVDSANGVLSNDLNPDRTDLMAVLESDVSAGSLTLNADGSFRYDPEQFAGIANFTYRINDGTELSNPQTVMLNINTPPVANSDAYEVTEDVQLITSIADGVAANDLDAEGDSLTATLVSPPTNGTLELNADGSFQYLPAENYFGEDSFSYQLADWIDSSEVATVQLMVNAVDDPPVATSELFFTEVGGSISKTAAGGVLKNDFDIDSESLTVELVSGPTNGALTLESDGSFSYTPNAQFSGTDSFSYRANDGNSSSEAVDVQLFVGTAPVQISELLSANISSLSTRTRLAADDSFRGDESREDWIELQNMTTSQLDLTGFHLSDDPDDLSKWQFPEGTIIPPSGYLTVFASRLDVTDPTLDELGMLHTNFTLQVEGEYLAVTSPNGEFLHGFDSYPRQTPDVSYGLTESGDEVFLVEATPTTANGAAYDGVVSDVVFSVDRGFFSEPFQVAITTETPNVEIRYTTNGSTPTATEGEVYTEPINITTTTNLRATAFVEGYVPSRTTTHSYLFLEDVINQGNSPEGYPEMFGLGPPNNHPWAPRPADYEMDPEITQSPKYKDLMDDALLAIPSVNIVTDIANLFDTDIGIYQNTDNHGVEWERPASIEMIMPDGSTAFQIDAGVRMHGGASREPWKNPKHGFRLKFKGIYGYDDLEYDWFGGDAATEFDEIVLRAGSNQAWTHHNNFEGDNRSRGQYIRDQWVNDTYRAMGHPAPHTDYAHVYVNGIYWGLYNPKERPKSEFMASYFGGSELDYDVLNAGSLLDGRQDAWRELNDREFRDLSDDAKYEQFSEMLDIDPFIDYMIMNHYGGNIDWDSHNWYAAHRREPDGKFIFIPWDGEFFFIRPNDNKVRSIEAQPGRLFRNLQSNDEFLMRFADRIQMHMFNDGLLTPDSVVERWEVRSSQIDVAIIGESARWGDFRRDVDRQGIAPPFELIERDVQWVAERERLMTEYFPVRTEIVVEQYRRASLFPDTSAPVFDQRGGYIASTDDIVLSAEMGTIYYTTDGSDPRLPGGDLNPTAIEYTGAFRLDSPSTVRTRALNNDEWSAIDQATFLVDVQPASSSNLRVVELNYNPSAPSEEEIAAGHNNNDDFEFAELLNVSGQYVDLTGVQFVRVDIDGDSNGVDFAFADNTLLEPGQRIVVVEDLEAFAMRYGDEPLVAGQWSGRLSNAGEQLTLVSGETTLQQFTYDDEWYPTTDGDGFTLEIVNPLSADLESWGTKDAWRASGQLGGTPGADGAAQVLGDSNRDGVFDSSDLVAVFTAGEYEDDVAGNSTFEEGDWNGDGDFDSSDLVAAFQAGTYQSAAVGTQTRIFESLDELRKEKDRLFAQGIDEVLDDSLTDHWTI